jgi:hypothetical protein
MTKADEPVATVTWEEPATQRGRYDWLAIADELKSKPNMWAKLFDDE